MVRVQAPRPGVGLGLHVGGARLQAHSADPRLPLMMSPGHQAFAGLAQDPDIALIVDGGPPAPLPRARTLFRSGGLWHLLASGDELVFQLTSPAFGSRPYRTLRLDGALQRGQLTVHAPCVEGDDRAPVVPFEYPLDELLVVNWLARGRGVELHACGVVDQDGRGILFCGQSGAGKSTAGRLWQQGEPGRDSPVLSDDRIIVRSERGALFMYGTPWHGEATLARAARVPCKGLVLLEQAPQTQLMPLPPAEAVSRLFACSFVPFHDPESLGFTLDFLTALVTQLPCLVLRFRRDSSFVPLVRAALY